LRIIDPRVHRVRLVPYRLQRGPVDPLTDLTSEKLLISKSCPDTESRASMLLMVLQRSIRHVL
jgi:hypothetical protein